MPNPAVWGQAPPPRERPANLTVDDGASGAPPRVQGDPKRLPSPRDFVMHPAMSVPPPLSPGGRLFPRPKLVWGTHEAFAGHWRLGLFCSYERHPGFPGTGLALSGRGLVRWAGALGVVGYFAGAMALTYWFSQNPYSQVGLPDVLTWPVRREHMTRLRGRAWLAQGRDALKARRWGEGVFLLGRGLEVCPDDLDARLKLAQAYLVFGERQRGLAFLAEGPLHGQPSRLYLQEALQMAAGDEDWERVLTICERSLPRVTGMDVGSERQWLLGQKLQALIALDRAGEAVKAAEAEGDAAGAPVQQQRALALLALSRTGDALTFLNHWRESGTTEMQPVIIRLQARALREAGRMDDLEQALEELRRLHPSLAEPSAFGVTERVRAGRGAEAALADYVFRFGHTLENLMLLAQPLAQIPAAPLIERLVKAAAERGLPVRPLQVKLVDAWIRAGNWPAAARLVAELAPQFAPNSAEASSAANGQPPPLVEIQARIWYEGIRRLSAAVSSPATGSQELVKQFVQLNRLSLDAVQFIATALRRAGREETAREVLAVAARTFPASPWVRAQQTSNESALAAAAGVAGPLDIPDKPAVGPKDWDEFRRSMELLQSAGQWTAARDFLRTMRFGRSPPAWVAAHEPELLWLDVRVAQAFHEVPALRAAVRAYLNGTAVRAADVLNFARDLHGRQEVADALLLVKAVLEKSPDHPMAAKYLKEWPPSTEAK